MKKLLFIVALLTGHMAIAQELKVGVTGRLGAFTTIVSPGNSENADYSVGLQATIGAWARLPVTAKSAVQLNLLQTAERQNAGIITIVDPDRSPLTDAKVTDRNLAVALQGLYVHTINEKWRIGAGAGAKYEYLSKARVKAETDNRYYSISFDDAFDNTYRRELTLHLPVEIQYVLNERIAVAGQLQLQISNRLNPSETAFRENDLGLVVGVNYSL